VLRIGAIEEQEGQSALSLDFIRKNATRMHELMMTSWELSAIERECQE
jgi:hypothetical protein